MTTIFENDVNDHDDNENVDDDNKNDINSSKMTIMVKASITMITMLINLLPWFGTIFPVKNRSKNGHRNLLVFPDGDLSTGLDTALNRYAICL